MENGEILGSYVGKRGLIDMATLADSAIRWLTQLKYNDAIMWRYL